MENVQGIVPTMDYSRNCDNDGWGNNFGIWMLFLLFALNRDNRNDYAREDTVNSNFIQRDVTGGFQNLNGNMFNGFERVNENLCAGFQGVNNNICGVDKTILNAQYNLGSKIDQANFDNQQCCCDTQKEILESRYASALQAQNMQAQMSQCCCDVKEAIHAEGEATRAMIQADKIEQLREQVYTTNAALNNANLANNIINQLRPYPQPSYITCSPYESAMFGRNGFNNCGCNCGF